MAQRCLMINDEGGDRLRPYYEALFQHDLQEVVETSSVEDRLFFMKKEGMKNNIMKP